MLVFGAVGSYPFFKHLINSLIFQTSLFNLGRCEMILAMPPPIYIVNKLIIPEIYHAYITHFPPLASHLQQRDWLPHLPIDQRTVSNSV